MEPTDSAPLDILSFRQTPTEDGMKMNNLIMIMMFIMTMIMIISFSIQAFQEIYCVFLCTIGAAAIDKYKFKFKLKIKLP